MVISVDRAGRPGSARPPWRCTGPTRWRAVFPDGQLYVNLRGFDPAGPPMTPAEAIRGFLDALGVRAGQHPGRAWRRRSALYRSLLAGRRMLVAARQRPRRRAGAPAAAGAAPACLVLVTSRSQLAGLAAADGARPLTLDVLTDAEAQELLAARLGADRLAAEPAAAQRADRRCAPGCRSRWPSPPPAPPPSPRCPLADLAAELRDAGSRLDALDAGRSGRQRPGGVLLVLPAARRRRRRGCSGCWACIPARTSAPRPRPAWPASRPRQARTVARPS